MSYQVIKINAEGLEFNDDIIVESYHDQDCCEYHWLDFSTLSAQDFKDLTFDLDNFEQCIEKVDGYGIRLISEQGIKISVPGYGSNNGYYSANLSIVKREKHNKYTGNRVVVDISDCQSEEQGTNL